MQYTKFFRGWLRGFLLGGLALSTAAITVALAIAPARAMSLILVDADSGKVLRSENATYPWYPASTTKLMTLYMTLSAMRDQRITSTVCGVSKPERVAETPSTPCMKSGR